VPTDEQLPAAVTKSQRIVRFVMRKTDDISSWTTEVVCNIHTGYQLPTIVTFNTLFVPYSHRRQKNQGSTRRMEAALLLVIVKCFLRKAIPLLLGIKEQRREQIFRSATALDASKRRVIIWTGSSSGERRRGRGRRERVQVRRYGKGLSRTKLLS
jgi:uncharacterized protein YceK